jgi:hypothetical protein
MRVFKPGVISCDLAVMLHVFVRPLFCVWRYHEFPGCPGTVAAYGLAGSVRYAAVDALLNNELKHLPWLSLCFRVNSPHSRWVGYVCRWLCLNLSFAASLFDSSIVLVSGLIVPAFAAETALRADANFSREQRWTLTRR